MSGRATLRVTPLYAEMCSGVEAGSYFRRKDLVHHSTLGWRVGKKKRRACVERSERPMPPGHPSLSERDEPGE